MDYRDIESYLDKAIPKGIRKKRRQDIREELRCHIQDRVSFYTEIGYSTDAAIEKSLKDIGDDQETVACVKEDFSKVYHDKAWMGILSALSVLVLNIICAYSDSWLISFDSGWGGNPRGILIGGLCVFFAVSEFLYAVKKRNRAMLIGFGLSNVLFTAFFFINFYAQTFTYGIATDICYLIDRFTVIDVSVDLIDADVWAFSGYGFTFILSVACIVAAIRCKKSFKPKSFTRKGVIGYLSVWTLLLVAVPLIQLGIPEYLSSQYYGHFGIVDAAGHDYAFMGTDKAFELIDRKMTLQEAEKLLKAEGYCTLEEYESGLPRIELKQHKRGFSKAWTILDDEYVYFLNPELDSLGRFKSRLIYIKADKTDGKLTKCRGNVLTLDRMYYTSIRLNSTDNVFEDFLKLERGTPKKELLDKFILDYEARLANEFCTYDEEGTASERYRFYLYQNINFVESVATVDLYFTDDLLTDGVFSLFDDGEYPWGVIRSTGLEGEVISEKAVDNGRYLCR